MKILIVCETQGQGFGAERVLEYLLAGWVDLGLQVENPIQLLAPQDAAIHEFAEKLSIPHTPFRGVTGKLPQNMIAAKTFAKTSDLIHWADVIHAWTARAFELVVLLAKATKKTPISGTLHDHPHALFHGRVRQEIMKRSANRMQGLACVSKAVENAVGAAGYQCPTTVCHNGIPPQKNLVSKITDQHPTRLGFLGLYADRKGFDLICPWIHQTAEMDVVWNLYGEPTPKNKILLKSLPPNVQLMGWTPMPEIWPNVDILVHASTQFDPFPTVLLEAAQAGIPSLASNLGGATEIIKDGVTGYLFDPRSTEKTMGILKQMIDSINESKIMGEAANKIYQASFTAKEMSERYLSFWSNLT
jgi:glycosyltransferase involved in cell wall biosynthesis